MIRKIPFMLRVSKHSVYFFSNPLVFWPGSSPNIFPPHSSQKSPLPLFSKEGLNFYGEILPLKKGDRGGFEYEFGRSHRLNFLNELLRHHTRVGAQVRME
jgi:hypothetical protein